MMESDPLLTPPQKQRSRTRSIGASSKYSSSQRSRRSRMSSSVGSVSSRRPSIPIPTQLPYDVVRVRIITSCVIILAGMAYFPLTVVISQYLHERLAKEALIASNGTFIDFYKVQADATRKIQHYTYMQCIPALLSSLLVGAYSDFIGRRITLLLPLLGQLLKGIVILFIVKKDLDYGYFYLGYGIDGVLGSWFVALTAVYSITADTNFHKNQRLLWIMISAGLANVASAGSLICNAQLTKHVGYTSALITLVVYMSIALVIPLILLPETLPPPDSTPANPWKSIRRVFSIFTTEGTVKHRLTLLTLLVMFFFSVINDIGCPSIDVLYQMSPPFLFDSNEIGLYACIKIGGQAFFGMFLMKGLQYFMKAEYIGMLASTFQTGMYVMESFVEKKWQMFLVPIVGIPGCLIAPTVRGIMSVLAGPDHQGAVFASVAVTEVLSTIAANTVFNEIYADTVSYYSGAVYVTMAAFASAPILIFFVYFRLYEFGNHEYYYEEYVDVPSDFVGSGTMSISLSMNNSGKVKTMSTEMEKKSNNVIEYEIRP